MRHGRLLRPWRISFPNYGTPSFFLLLAGEVADQCVEIRIPM